ncbi:MAG: hypothetical protein KGK07_14415 [Chloroflexota bacterium]|nr:hypothetical protein [Chloroflexota bacterium]
MEGALPLCAALARRLEEEVLAGRPLPASVALSQDEYDALCAELGAHEAGRLARWKTDAEDGVAIDELLGLDPELGRRRYREFVERHRAMMNQPLAGVMTNFGFVRVESPQPHACPVPG